MSNNNNSNDDPLLGIDQALLRVRFAVEELPEESNYSLWLQSAECYQCPLVETRSWNSTSAAGDFLLAVDTKYPLDIAVRNSSGNLVICQFREHFGEHGSYNLTIGGENDRCAFQVVVEPENSYLPILYLFTFYIILWTMYYAIKKVYAAICCRKPPNQDRIPSLDETAEEEPTTVQPPRKVRLRSLDAFRGLAIVIMIFVNLGGGGYSFFQHSVWNGLTVADLVFPWFLFIMGTSAYLSTKSAFRRFPPGSSSWSLLYDVSVYWLNKVLRRGFILFTLGLLLNGRNGDLKTLRIFGVLQRIGVTYTLIGSLLCLHFILITGASDHSDSADQGAPARISSSDVTGLWLAWLLVILVGVVCPLLVTFLLPLPPGGCPTGYLGPGGLHDGGAALNCTGGAAGYVDRMVLSYDHLYRWPTCKKIYHTEVPYDPEGLLGTLASTLTVFLGVQAGATLSRFPSPRGRIIRWLTWATLCSVAGLVLCRFQKDAGWIPVNKNLWSLSYVLVMAGLSYAPLAGMYYVIDVRRWWNGAPLYQAGMNSILLYLGHECFGRGLPFSWRPLSTPDTHAWQLVMNAWATSLFVLLAVYLHGKGIFLSV